MTKSHALKTIGLSILLIAPTITASGQDTKGKVGKAPEVQALAGTLRSLKYVLVNVIQDRQAKTRTTKDGKPKITITVTVVATEIEDAPDDTAITCKTGTDEGMTDCESFALQLSAIGYVCTSEKDGSRCEAP